MLNYSTNSLGKEPVGRRGCPCLSVPSWGELWPVLSYRVGNSQPTFCKDSKELLE